VGVLLAEGVCVVSRTRSLRAMEGRWELWASAALERGLSLNAWMCQACDLVADRDLAEVRRAAAERAEREALRGVMRGEG
jgi:hypothetical protein